MDGIINHGDFKTPSEDKVARVLAEREAGRLRYCHDACAWFLWDGVAWRRDRTGAVVRRIRDLAVELGTDPWDDTVRAACGEPAFVAGIERFARGEPALAVTAEAWDTDPLLLGTPDGPVALGTGDVVPAAPAQGISRVTAVAPAEAADCPLWRRFLDETFGGDAALIGFLQRFLGYGLTGSVGEQVMLYGCGPGGTGKSVLFNTVAGVLGDYARPAPAELMRGRRAGDLAALRGARLVALGEADAGRPWRDARMKLMTAGDPIADGSRRRDTAVVPRFKLVALGNRTPLPRDADAATLRRLLVLPFAHRPVAVDRDLEAKLRPEWPAILRWMIEGCRDWLACGLSPPPAVRAATDDLVDDVLGQFLEESCERAPDDPGLSAPAGALFAAWSAYATAAGEAPGSPRGFAEALCERGFRRDRTHAGRIFRGVGLRSPDGGVTA